MLLLAVAFIVAFVLLLYMVSPLISPKPLKLPGAHVVVSGVLRGAPGERSGRRRRGVLVAALRERAVGGAFLLHGGLRGVGASARAALGRFVRWVGGKGGREAAAAEVGAQRCGEAGTGEACRP